MQNTRMRSWNTNDHPRIHFVLITIVLVGIVSLPSLSAEVIVIRCGTGNGMVTGKKIFCGPSCEAHYEAGTRLEFDALPDEGSTFEGWLVNGVPHEGAILIPQHDLLISARFTLQHWSPPKRLVWWYAQNIKVMAFLVLDEFAVILNDEDMSTPDASDTILQTVSEYVEPYAELAHVAFGDLVFFTLQASLSEDQLSATVHEIEKLPGVKQVSPVLYEYPDEREGWSVPSGEVLVKFAKSLTIHDIQRLETEFGLVRMAERHVTPHEVRYWEDDPLQSIEIAKQIYESGYVEYSIPNIATDLSVSVTSD